MEKVFNNQATIAKKMQNKVRRPVLVLPNVVFDAKGQFVIGKGYVEISDYEQFCKYISTQSAVIEYLKANYPSVIAKIYKNALSELTDPEKSTIAGKLLTGKNVRDIESFDAGLATNGESTVYGIIKTINTRQSGVKGKKVVLPVVKRPKSTVMSMFARDKKGYFVPEIDENGLVVIPSKDKSHFNLKFIGVKESDVTKEQLIEFFKAPFGDKADESGVDFEKLVELCKNAYKSMEDSNSVHYVQEISDFCAASMPLSFANIKDDRILSNISKTVEGDADKSTEIQNQDNEDLTQVVDEEPIEEPVQPEPVVEENNDKALVVLAPNSLEPVYVYSVGTSNIKSFSKVMRVYIEKKPLVTQEDYPTRPVKEEVQGLEK